MAIDSDIRDQAYQFFIQEAPELLQVIEAELLTLKEERTTAKVHNVMRAAHSIKGGSASVGLEAIKILAHRLEDIFKALHHEELEIDDELESLLLQAYDCLRLPLMEQITTGYFDPDQAIAIAEPVLAQIEAQLEGYLGQDDFLPSSTELGIDITLSIFEVDVIQGLERLTTVLADPETNEVVGELRAQAEVFTGIAELLSLPGFGEIAQTTLAALDAHPDRVLDIAKLALADFQAGTKAVIEGDRTQGGTPSAALAKFAGSSPPETLSEEAATIAELSFTSTNAENGISTFSDDQETVTPTFSVDDIFGSSTSNLQNAEVADNFHADILDYSELRSDEQIPQIEETVTPTFSIDDIFGSSSSNLQNAEVADNFHADILDYSELRSDEQIPQIEETVTPNLSIDDIFGSSASNLQDTQAADNFHADILDYSELRSDEQIPQIEETVTPNLSIDDIFGSSASNLQDTQAADNFHADILDYSELRSDEQIPQIDEEVVTPALSIDDIFGSSASNLQNAEVGEVDLSDSSTLQAAESSPEIELVTQEETVTQIPTLDDIFSTSASPPPTKEVADLFEVDLPDSQPLQAIESAPQIQEDTVTSIPSLDDIFGRSASSAQSTEVADSFEINILDGSTLPAAKSSSQEKLVTEEDTPQLPSQAIAGTPVATPPQELLADLVESKAQPNIQDLVQSIEQVFDSLPLVEEVPSDTLKAEKPSIPPATAKPPVSTTAPRPVTQEKNQATSAPTNATAQLSVRVDLERLERMNNLVGELSINRNSLSLQNEQLQGTVKELLRRFARFQEMGHHLRDLSDHMLVAPERHPSLQHLDTSVAKKAEENVNQDSLQPASTIAPLFSGFDSLEMDSYGELHSLLQDTLEEMVQLEEIVGDVALLAGQSSKTLEGQRQMVTHLRDDLMWARMLPLNEVLSRFPRTLRDLSTKYNKPVDLKLSGTGVLVDKVALEKLNDPLLHLLRNAFDHGIEPREVRRQQGKPERAQIEIRAYHQGSQTVIEMRDDGKGINLERVRDRAVESGLLSSEQVATTPTSRLLDLIFEPGFSTASQVSELSGRGVGLDVVRSQLRSLKGTVTVNFVPGKGTTFTLRIPLTLTIAKLLVCLVGSTAYALPSDSIEEILIPKADQMKLSGKQRFLHWRRRIVPVYHLSELLDYACPLPESIPSQALVAVPTPEDWAPPMLLLRQDNQFLALELDRLVTEQELVIKPFGAAIAPPRYIYGCTILGDGSLVPVIDASTLLNQIIGSGANTLTARGTSADLAPATLSNLPATALKETSSNGKAGVPTSSPKSPLILVVDDSIALRQTLALTLQKAGYRVLQARDGREAVEQLHKNSGIQLVVSDVEMPNMNGFEFLNHRRQDPVLSKVPVVMLTSRSSDKHKRLATHLGASAYFTKPYLEQEFLAGLQGIIDKGATVGATPQLASS